MEVLLYGQKFNVIVEKKNNKNMYLRVKKDGIHITCNYFVTKSMILSFINKNKDSIIKMNEVVKRKEEKEEEFYYLGNKYDVVILNFANTDMVGHTGSLQAAIKAVEAVDECVGKIVKIIEEKKGNLLITADHGNAEQMIDYKTG